MRTIGANRRNGRRRAGRSCPVCAARPCWRERRPCAGRWGWAITGRSLGRCRAGRQIDREFGARLEQTGVSGNNLFTYVRYDADLSDEALKSSGIQDPKRRKRLRTLDAVDEIPLLQELGRRAAADVDLDRRLAGFLDS